MKQYRIAAIPGDGIGKEVLPEGVKALQAACAREGVELQLEHFPWGGEHYLATGELLPDDALAKLRGFDAIYFGAIGHPQVDEVFSQGGFVLKLRKQFQQYVNLRPIRLLPGLRSPLRDRGPADIDMLIVRENNEGEYAGVGGILNGDAPEGLAVQSAIFTRAGISRVARYAFELARTRRGKLTNVTKSNALPHGMVYWDRVVEEVRAEFPDVAYDKLYVDAAATAFVLNPGRFDVIVTTNMFGDILSDLGAGLVGSLGLAPSGNINPERSFPSMFEPIHGSAPDIAGRGIANPLATIWSGAMLLEHLGEAAAAARVRAAIDAVAQSGPHSRDLGGSATTSEVGEAVARVIQG
jgi:tartrate dehydrogenase/decarboxylase / D-malate dehydrogenase